MNSGTEWLTRVVVEPFHWSHLQRAHNFETDKKEDLGFTLNIKCKRRYHKIEIHRFYLPFRKALSSPLAANRNL